MGDFLVRQMDYTLFVNGLVFLILSVVGLHLSRRSRMTAGDVELRWGYFSLFAVLQGAERWMAMGAVAYQPGAVYSYGRVVIVWLSFLCLFEFGRLGLRFTGKRWRMGWWTCLLLAVGSLAGAGMGPEGLEVSVRYVLGLSGTAVAASALIGAGRTSAGRGGLGAVGWSLLSYGLIYSLIVPRVPFFPASLLNGQWLLEMTGMPVELLQLVPVTAMLIALWRLRFHGSGSMVPGRSRVLLQAVMAVVVVLFLSAGWYLVKLAGDGAESDEQRMVLEQAGTVAVMLDRQDIIALSAKPADIESPSYRKLLAQVTRVWLMDQHLRGIYLLVPYAGTAVYSVSVESGRGGNYPPGAVYSGEPPGISEVFDTGKARFAGPFSGVTGTVVSGLAPVTDEHGRTVAVLRYDVGAEDWNRTIARARVMPITLLLVLGLIIVYFMMDRARLRDLKQEADSYQAALVSLAAVDTSDLNAALDMVAHKVVEVTGTTGVSFWRVGGEGYLFDCIYSWRTSGDSRACISLERRLCPIFFAVLERERVVAAEDAVNDRRTAELAEGFLGPLGLKSIVAVVMSQDGEGKGLMVVEQAGSIRKWSSEEVVFISAAAQFGALSLETAQRRAAERAAVESQKRTAQIIDFLPDAAFVIDSDGKVIYWNNAIQKLTGVPAQDIIGKGNYEHALVFRGERVPSLADYAMKQPGEIPARYPGAVNREGVWFADVYLPKLRGGIWLALAAGLLKDEQGKVVGAIETLRDITPVKQAEEALRAAKENADRMNRQLEQAMSHANRMAIEAALANEAKSAFLATMSHEIRTPMNGIIGMTGLLLDTPLSQEQRQYAETVRSSAEALLSIINDILDFSKIEAGRMELEKAAFNLLSVVEGVFDIVALRAREKGLELGYVIAPQVPEWLEGDAGRLRQILTNLVGNAVKFTHKGEVSVKVELKEKSDSRVKLYFAVRDTGIGIPADKIGSLFKPFTQVDASTTRKYGGTGLGLSIAKSLVEAMGGEIGVESEEGKGSTFWFTVVLGVAARPERVAEGVVDISGARLLVVDDNEINRQLLSRMLENWGCRCDTASGAAEGLEMMRKAKAEGRPYDAVLTDMLMPEIDGEQFARMVRSQPGLDRTPLVLMTSLGGQGDPSRLREMGFAAHMLKPLKQAQVRETLVSVLGKAAPAVAESRPEAAKPVGRLRILVAEDNVTSQKVAQALLAKMGHHSDAVANGLEAVRALESIPYDMVLMDVQMPEMDGIQATRVIRDPSSKVLDHRIPVIALTAYAMKGDEEKFRAAGMDDYVTKPVTPEALAAAIQRQAARVKSPTPSPAPAVAAAPAVFDREGVMKRFGGDEALLKEIVSIFLEDAPARIKSIREALGKGDAASVHREGHTLKGGAANVGAMVLRDIGYRIEEAGRNSELGTLSDLLNMAERALDDFRNAVKGFESRGGRSGDTGQANTEY